MTIQNMDHHEAIWRLLGAGDETVFDAIVAKIMAGKTLLNVGDSDLLAHIATQHMPLPRYPLYTPSTVGAHYNGNGPTGTGNRTTGTALNTLIIGSPLFSGASGITIDQLNVNIVTAGTAGAVYRMGLWIIDNQSNPFGYVAGSQYASLFTGGDVTVDATTTGVKTSAVSLVIPANTWFVVGGVSQVAVCQPTIGATASVWSPHGQALVTSAVAGVESFLQQQTVSGALGPFVPNVTTPNINIGHGTGFRRSV